MNIQDQSFKITEIFWIYSLDSKDYYALVMATNIQIQFSVKYSKLFKGTFQNLNWIESFKQHMINMTMMLMLVKSNSMLTIWSKEISKTSSGI